MRKATLLNAYFDFDVSVANDFANVIHVKLLDFQGRGESSVLEGKIIVNAISATALRGHSLYLFSVTVWGCGGGMVGVAVLLS